VSVLSPKMPAATGLAETKERQKMKWKSNPNR